MPQDFKKRGRREEKKRKQVDAKSKPDIKRQKKAGEKKHALNEEEKFVTINDRDLALPVVDTSQAVPFYGLLKDEEQEYFKRADEMLELDQFGDVEERKLFLANIFKEAEGKELKIACSQSSRTLERLIMLSSPSQLKDLFSAFNGHYAHLVRHRFASHCCETLFLQSAQVVTKELMEPQEHQAAALDGHVSVSMENLFLYAFNELEEGVVDLLTHIFASHVLRVLIVILSGQPLARTRNTSLMESKKKDRIVTAGAPMKLLEQSALLACAVPSSFSAAVDKVISTVQGLDSTSLQALATHPLGNPVLQLLLEIELSRPGKSMTGSERSILQGLITEVKRSDEVADHKDFLSELMFDPVGSHLLETIVRYAPGKTFKSIYRETIKDKMGEAAKDEVASFVVIRVLERLSREDLEDAVSRILPHFQALVRRSRTAVIKTIIERYAAREINLDSIANALEDAYGGNSPWARLRSILRWGDEDNLNEAGPNKDATNCIKLDHGRRNKSQNDASRVHGSLLAQAMLVQPGPLSSLVYEGLLDLPTQTTVHIANDPAAARALQASLVLPTSTATFRRKFVVMLSSYVAELAVSPVGSHLVDAMWPGTRGLQHCRERVAQQLCENELKLRNSYTGRAVWKNWKMDLYKQRRLSWLAHSRASERSLDTANKPTQAFTEKQTSIESARRRYNTSQSKTAVRIPTLGQRTPRPLLS